MFYILAVGITTCAFIILSILLLPEIKIGRLTLGTYWIVALFGALVILCSGKLETSILINGLCQSRAVNPIKILILFLSMTGLSVFLDETGFFRIAAQAVLKKAKSSQRLMFLYLYLTVAVLTVFTSNDIIVLTFTPFICYFAKNAKISPVPFLFAEFVAANTWSMALIIGNPTNIYLASSYNIGFFEYAGRMLMPTIWAGVASFVLLYLIFHKKLSMPISQSIENYEGTNKVQLTIGLIHLTLCTAFLAISSYVHMEMWLISLGFFLSLIICNLVYAKLKGMNLHIIGTTFKRLPWELIPFVISMFIIVLALSEYGFTTQLAKLFGEKNIPFTYAVTSFFSANIINNIPMSVLFVKILESVPAAIRTDGIYAAIIGSNLGAFFTPIGALAGIMWTSILKKLDVQFKFSDFIKYGAIISIPTLLAATVGLIAF